MSKGERTRQAILEEALDQASVMGLDGLSIGGLAGRMGLSKSGLFAHFGSKEALVAGLCDRMLERFDRVLVMHEGRIVEQGSYDDLNKPGSALSGIMAAE